MPAIGDLDSSRNTPPKNTKRTPSDKNMLKKNAANLHKRKPQENQENKALQKCIDETKQKTAQILELERKLSKSQEEKAELETRCMILEKNFQDLKQMLELYIQKKND